jgi:hypothetical protein
VTCKWTVSRIGVLTGDPAWTACLRRMLSAVTQ